MNKMLITLTALTLTATPLFAKKHHDTQGAAPATGIFGRWQTARQEDENRTATVEIFPCDGDNAKICGKIVALEEPIDPETNAPKLDKHNPDESLRTRPILGVPMLKGFEKKDDKTYENGSIYSPRTGKTYASSLKLVDDSTLDVTGYIFFFSKTQQWKRVQ